MHSIKVGKVDLISPSDTVQFQNIKLIALFPDKKVLSNVSYAFIPIIIC